MLTFTVYEGNKYVVYHVGEDEELTDVSDQYEVLGVELPDGRTGMLFVKCNEQ